MDQSKTCASCRQPQPLHAFNRSRSRKDGRDPYCRTCRSAMHRGEDPRVPDPNQVVARPGEKVCGRCRESKPPTSFSRDRRRLDGLFPYCRECKQTSDRESHARHKPKRNAAMRAHYEAKKDVYKARTREYYRVNPDYVKRNALAWALANPERRLEIRKASFLRAWEADPERFREAWRKRQAAVRRGCRVYGVTTEQIAAKVAYWGYRCYICLGPYDSIDHVKPLAKQGPHMVANLRPICTPCNTRKLDRWPLPGHLTRRNHGLQEPFGW